MKRVFGRLPSPDVRDRRFLAARLLPDVREVALPRAKTWPIAARNLDQGVTGTCVGHAWRNFLRCAPLRTETGPSAYTIYRKAIQIDPWVANDAEANYPDGDARLAFGTSVRAGAEAVTAMGHLKSYVWAFDLQTATEWVLLNGPMVMGTDWYTSFRNTDAEGIIRITPTARISGGHAWLLRGIDTSRALAHCTNSWGDDWGRSGNFFLPLRDLERLIREDGEACAAVEQRLRPTGARR